MIIDIIKPVSFLEKIILQACLLKFQRQINIDNLLSEYMNKTEVQCVTSTSAYKTGALVWPRRYFRSL